MVIYFTSNVVTPPRKIFMGVDKFENEDLIKWGWPEDVWFHVDKVSSAHVYLRLNEGETLDDVPAAVIDDCAQLVKANSITGNKMNNVDVVYTMWANLLKTPKMDVGQVGFKNQREVKKVKVEKRINEIVNRLEKTKVVKEADLRAEREERDRKEREDKKAFLREMKQKEKEDQKRKEELEKLKSYDNVMKPENMKTNKDCDSEDSDDFM